MAAILTLPRMCTDEKPDLIRLSVVGARGTYGPGQCDNPAYERPTEKEVYDEDRSPLVMISGGRDRGW